MGVAIGVDSHKSSLAAAALDELGRVISTKEFSNDGRGHQALLKWSLARGGQRIIGIEGAGSYGAGLARHLVDAGEDVYEVPTFLLVNPLLDSRPDDAVTRVDILLTWSHFGDLKT